MRIDVFHTHIEVSPYKKGDFFELEKAMSRWRQVSKKHGKYEPMTYFIDGDTLYIPKGINIELLENRFGVLATMHREPTPSQKMSRKYDVTLPPRSSIQRRAVDFLTSSGDYASGSGYCQYTLNLETAAGKTYCAINSFTQMGIKTMVIVNREYLASHWKSEIMKFTNIPEDRIMILNTENIRRVLEMEVDADVYITLHQSLQSFARSGRWEDINELMSIAGIGLKYYDEAHEFYASTFTIDCFTNVKKTFYLTATLGRSNPQEKRGFLTMLSASYKLDDKRDEKDRHITYIAVRYTSELNQKQVWSIKGAHGFSPYRFIDNALYCDPKNALRDTFLSVLDTALNLDGQILVVSPKKDSVKYFADLIQSVVGSAKTVGTIFSDNDESVNFENQKCDIISSTIKSCGTGFNPPNLQTIICMEPHMSSITSHQLKGRLDRYPGDNTYMFMLLDRKIPYMENVFEAHKRNLKGIVRDFEELSF